MAEEICKRLRFSNEETEQIVALVNNHMRFKDVESMRTATLKKFVRQPHFDEHLALHRLDCLCSNRHLEAYEFLREFIARTPEEEVRPERLLSGDDLQRMGFRPGPVFSEILGALEEGQLEGEIQTREDAERFVLKKYGQSGRSA